MLLVFPQLFYKRLSAVCACLLAVASFSSPQSANADEICTYTTWEWNSWKQISENHREVTKLRSELLADEINLEFGCSICEEDQTTITISGIPPFKICKFVAEEVERAVIMSLAEGFPISQVVGYRVGRSKGDLDEDGRRTSFSNHSFGLAVDINPDKNGLYGNCIKPTPSCRLLRGGKWQPNQPGSITPNSPVYIQFIAMGWHWGGDLVGQQKDFMHFSPIPD